MAGLKLPGNASRDLPGDGKVAQVGVDANSMGTTENQPNVTPRTGPGQAPGAGI